MRAAKRIAAAAQRANDPEKYKRWYDDHRDTERARIREVARRRRRLAALGLPPRQIHRVYAAERRSNDAAADTFFSQRRTAKQRREIAAEADQLARLHAAVRAARRRAIEAPSTEQVRREIDRSRTARERYVWAHAVPKLVTAFVEANSDRIRAELEMDSVARRVARKQPYDAPREYARRLRIECFEYVAARLAPEREPARLGRLHAFMFPSHQIAPQMAPHDVAVQRERHALAMAENSWHGFPPALEPDR